MGSGPRLTVQEEKPPESGGVTTNPGIAASLRRNRSLTAAEYGWETHQPWRVSPRIDFGVSVAPHLVNTSDARAHPSPLWIIALFIGLSEAVAVLAALVTSGMVQTGFFIFAVSFPVLVFAVFLWLLLKHPVNLYSPSQFSSQTTTIERYAAALTREQRDNTVIIRQAVSEALSDAVQGERVRERVSETFDRVVEKKGLITVDRSLLAEGAAPVQFPVTPDTKVAELLDSIFFSIAPVVEPFTYNKSWVLSDGDGALLKDIGTKWAEQHGSARDERSITEAGIDPGSTLTVRPLPR